MLYPQNNPYRQMTDLSGFWDFRFAAADADFSTGFTGQTRIAVPASWNELFTDSLDNLGPAWYQTRFGVPWGWGDKRVRLRFNSVNYLAHVYLNGVWLGEHEGGHLPFEFEVTDQLDRTGDNLLVVRVEGQLSPDRVPPGNIPTTDKLDTFADETAYPNTNFDFFPYCGIQRPVLLYATAPDAIEDITVITDLRQGTGLVTVRIVSPDPLHCSARLSGFGFEAETRFDSAGLAQIEVPEAALWGVGQPNLYELTIEGRAGGSLVDRYTLPTGIRTIRVDGDQLLLNDQPVYLKGFGRHEDFPINGRGYNPAVITRDYDLLRWIGANSYRTSHYPYSEQQLDLADQTGVLVIDETPAVGLHFNPAGLDRRLALCQEQLRALIARDKNHPSVIIWSIANEPHSTREGHEAFFRRLYDLATALDNTRPVTLVSYRGLPETSFEFLDVVCLNRYLGWYQYGGQIERGAAALGEQLDQLYARYGKPIILTEFGADAVPGAHALPAEMFTEEYQEQFIAAYIRVLRGRPYVVGEHVWNLCDFKTAQSVRRVGGVNYKGVFTRDRRPKLAAFLLRRLWTEG
jgi:beta-glucuronidase